MTVVELKKMVVDTSLNDLKHQIHYIIDGIASAKALDQYNAKCGEADRLREALKAAQDQFQFYADEHRSAGKTEKAQTNQAMADRCDAALQPKEGEG